MAESSERPQSENWNYQIVPTLATSSQLEGVRSKLKSVEEILPTLATSIQLKEATSKIKSLEENGSTLATYIRLEDVSSKIQSAEDILPTLATSVKLEEVISKVKDMENVVPILPTIADLHDTTAHIRENKGRLIAIRTFQATESRKMTKTESDINALTLSVAEMQHSTTTLASMANIDDITSKISAIHTKVEDNRDYLTRIGGNQY